MRRAANSFILFLTGALILGGAPRAAAEERVESALDILPAWSAIPVGFCLIRCGDHQLAAFYDGSRRLSVAARTLNSAQWNVVVLPEQLGWDSHNSITMGVDQDGCIHLSANMHVTPLVYFRTRVPYDIESFERVRHMVGSRESRCTYPRFLTGPGGDLIFSYREGQSGAGEDLYNVYEPSSRTWRRLLDRPLLSGHGRMSAYPIGPTLGPDGYFHLCWVWRDSIDVATNHDLSYARSKDLVHWETSSGRALALPMTLETGEVVDSVPVRGGLMNAGVALGFDREKRPTISYLKYDTEGNTQLYDARLENGVWRTQQISRWNYRWDLHGGGTVAIEIRYSSVHPDANGALVQSFSHIKLGSGLWVLDDSTLQPKALLRSPPAPPDLTRLESSFPGMHVRIASELVFPQRSEKNASSSSAGSTDPGVRYVLRWETLDANRDQPRTGRLPPPSMLKVLKLRTEPNRDR